MQLVYNTPFLNIASESFTLKEKNCPPIFRSHREASFLFFGRLLRQFSAESLRKKPPKLSNLQKSAKPLKIRT